MSGGKRQNKGQGEYKSYGGLDGKRGSNRQKQRNGFGTFVQKFQLASGKSKYGVPIFLPNGNVNPAYLKAEREEIQAQSKLNTKKAESKRKNLIRNNSYQWPTTLESK